MVRINEYPNPQEHFFKEVKLWNTLCKEHNASKNFWSLTRTLGCRKDLKYAW